MLKKACHRHLTALSCDLPTIYNPTLPGEEGLRLRLRVSKLDLVDLQGFFRHIRLRSTARLRVIYPDTPCLSYLTFNCVPIFMK